MRLAFGSQLILEIPPRMDVTRLRLAAVFLRFLPVPGATSIGVSSDKQLISVSLSEAFVQHSLIIPHIFSTLSSALQNDRFPLRPKNALFEKSAPEEVANEKMRRKERAVMRRYSWCE
jgi:hypothetical protein